ncbi:MAG: flagellar basal body P-ring protein FlgI [Deltaproteobacteria bacterium]|nr:flagellar basal body P-ring protein FlgI [Deltaproteobacteria bacterium]
MKAIEGYFLLAVLGILLFTGSLVSTPVQAERIKDIASLEGARENQLLGYGLVVGLNGTGDKGLATMQSIANMLARMGLTVNPKDIQAKDTAAVIITATLPPFPKPGIKIDAVVSALGDSKSLQGGTLLLAPLKGPDQKVYGLAQGPVSLGGFSAGAGGSAVQKNHPTTGRVPNGAIIERGLDIPLLKGNEIHLLLHNPDFTTAFQISQTINQKLGGEYAEAVDPSLIKLRAPGDFLGGTMGFISQIEALEVALDVPAKIVINERTGTVVMGERVRISPVAISHGSLTIEVTTDYKISQPPPFAPPKAETVVVPQTKVDVKEQKAALVEVAGITLGEVVRALNSLGVTPRDLIAILQALKSAGALKVELEII